MIEQAATGRASIFAALKNRRLVGVVAVAEIQLNGGKALETLAASFVKGWWHHDIDRFFTAIAKAKGYRFIRMMTRFKAGWCNPEYREVERVYVKSVQPISEV